MTDEQVRAFEAEPYRDDAVALRRWDDQAKDATVRTPAFEQFRPLLEGLVTQHLQSVQGVRSTGS
jgi:gamma-butyrobetaine dioxygenase